MRVAFYTLGCKVNQYESISLSEEFLEEGFELTDHSDIADIYVLNSCTVTGEADKKSRQVLRRFRKQNPSAVVALCGCFPQAFPKDSATIAEADIVLGTSNKKDLLQHVKNYLTSNSRVVKIEDYSSDDKFRTDTVKRFGNKTRAFIKIQDGCERFCAYCIIPFARGPVRSKPLDELLSEINALALAGYREIVLVGINLSCYGTDFGSSLLHAISTACSVAGIERVRLGSLEPELLSKDVIDQMAKQPKLCPQFHLSLQSGSDSTLARMRRHYTTADYTQIVENLRAAFDNCAITTDIMVGFPGETAEEFAQSLQFAKDTKFARAHVFTYSRREGTLAYKMPNQTNNTTKESRSKEMIAVTTATRKSFLESYVGRTEDVLFEVSGTNRWQGYTKNYTTVVVHSEENLARTMRRVEFTAIDGDSCIGKLV